MTNRPPGDARRPPTALVIGGWLLIQTAMLAWGTPVRWWPHHPMPAQSLALGEMVCLQIAVTALFSPLIDRWERALMLIAGAAFFQQAAAVLAAVPVEQTARVTLATGVWIAAARLPQKSGRSAVLPLALAATVFVPELINFALVSKAAAVPDGDLPKLIAGPIELALRQSDGVAVRDLVKLAAPGAVFSIIQYAANNWNDRRDKRTLR